MRWMIGFWIVMFAITFLVFFVFDAGMCFKEKIKSTFEWMLFITLLLVGINVMLGGL